MLVTVFLLLAPLLALGHAKVVLVEPADGAVITTPPPRVVVRFDGEIEARFHRAALVATDGAETPLQGARCADDAACFEAPLPTLAPGAWKVTWSVVSRDGHRVSGGARFEVRPP